MMYLTKLITYNVLPVLAFAALPKFADNKCLIPSPHASYAKLTYASEFSYMCAIGWLVNNTDQSWNPSYDFKCGGSLLNERFVLTAAHCFYIVSGIPEIVRVGGINLTDVQAYRADVYISEIIIHPGFHFPNSYNDIALLKLPVTNPISMRTLKVVQYAHLPTRDAVVGEVLTAIGYGQTKLESKPSDYLLKIFVNAVRNEECQQHFPPGGYIHKHGILDTQLCAVDPAKRMNTCQGDSGGPLLREHVGIHYVLGITSFGVGCEYGPAGVYTRVFQYVDWIESKMRSYKTEEYPYTFSLGWINHKICKVEKKQCGAVLIRWNFLLLPAHCLYDYEEIPRIFHVNNYDYGSAFEHQAYFIHPEYEHPFPYNDIALLQIELQPYIVTPIWIEDTLVNRTLTSINFAESSEDDIRKQNLLKTSLYLFPNEKCNKLYGYQGEGNFTRGVIDTHICAQDTEKKWDLKQGYSDGPLIMHVSLPNISTPYVVGVTSHARNCFTCPPAVFTRVSKYIHWIDQTVAVNISDLVANFKRDIPNPYEDIDP